MLAASFLLLVCLSLASNADSKPPRLVRINLQKKVLPQQGGLGQPKINYFTNINVGTPAKSFKMLVDVNAREIWLPHHSTGGRIRNRLNYKYGYKEKESTSVKEVEDDTYTISYKGTELTGKAYVDLFEFQNVTESVKEVKYMQRFLAMTAASNDKFGKFYADGVIAMNPWPISETGSDLITVGLSRAKLTGELKFSLELNTDAATDQGGELIFGGVDPTKYVGGLRYHKSQPQHSWELNLRGVMLGAESIVTANDECTALISSNSNDIYAPAKFVKQILQSLSLIGPDGHFDDKKLYELDCSRIASAPSLSLVIDQAHYVLQPSSYIKEYHSGRMWKTITCYVAILSSGAESRWELGTNFISNYYTVFDINQAQIAFGTKY